MVDYKRLTDEEIKKYFELIAVRSVYVEEKKGMVWMVCCKLCGDHLFPYFKEMEQEKVEQELKRHNCKGSIITENKKTNGN